MNPPAIICTGLMCGQGADDYIQIDIFRKGDLLEHIS